MPGPDLYTLRGMIELALDADVTVDAAHAVLSDGCARAFGPRWFERLTEALTAAGRDPDDLSVVLTDDRLAERVPAHLRTARARDDEAPDPPDVELVWSARPPDSGRWVTGPRATGGRA